MKQSRQDFKDGVNLDAKRGKPLTQHRIVGNIIYATYCDVTRLTHVNMREREKNEEEGQNAGDGCRKRYVEEFQKG